MLDRDEAIKRFHYDNETGNLIRISGNFKGSIAGCLFPNGYILVYFMGGGFRHIE